MEVGEGDWKEGWIPGGWTASGLMSRKGPPVALNAVEPGRRQIAGYDFSAHRFAPPPRPPCEK